MLPSVYQTICRKHLSEQQYLTLELVLLLIQAHRQVTLGTLASLFPQPIKYASRKRNIQRFLVLPRLSIKVLWFPLIKYWIRHLFMVTLVWGTHALPLYWELLNHADNSNLQTQKRLLKTALGLLKPYPTLVLGDREFHSPKLGEWLDQRGVYFALRQKKDFHFQQHPGDDYQVLRDQGFKPGMPQFYIGIRVNKGERPPKKSQREISSFPEDL